MKRIEIKYLPTKMQSKFHRCECDEVLFGGAAGGGKSYAIVMDAVDRCLRTPKIVAYLFRRTYRELHDTLIATARELIPEQIGIYRSTDHEICLINGSILRFRHMQSEEDKYEYQGAQIHALYIDELTHFSQGQYDFLKSRLRVETSKNIKPVVRCTSNPGGRGHGWVKSHFIDCALPEEVFGEEIFSKTLGTSKLATRMYIPARVTDNPHLNQDYVFELEQKPKALRDALLLGKWDAFEGQVFTEWVNDPAHYKDRLFTHVIAPFEIPTHWPRYRSFDFGYSRPFSVLWWAVGEDDEVYLYKEWYGALAPNVGVRLSPTEIARGIGQRDGGDKIEASFADPSIWDGSRGESVAEQMQKEGIYFLPGENARLAGKMVVHDRLNIDENGKCGMQVFGNCTELIRVLPELCYSPTHPEDIDTDAEDHSYDAMRYFLMNRVRGKKNPLTVRKKFNPLQE